MCAFPNCKSKNLYISYYGRDLCKNCWSRQTTDSLHKAFKVSFKGCLCGYHNGDTMQNNNIEELTLENYKEKTGKRFRKNKLAKSNGLSREQAFEAWKLEQILKNNEERAKNGS